MKKNSMIKKVVVGVVCVGVAVGGFFAIRMFNGSDKEKEVTTEQTSAVSVDTEGILPELVETYVENPDTIGWIKIDDTPIDYPVMSTPDDGSYYLERDFYKKKSAMGSLFIDANSQIEVPNSNVIIYGHNMKNKKMFGTLTKYKDKKYYETHPNIEFNTLHEKGTYEILGAFYAEILPAKDESFKYYKYFGAETEEEYNAFVDYVKSVREYDTGVETKYGDRFITLSTNSYHVENGRFVVVARLKEENK